MGGPLSLIPQIRRRPARVNSGYSLFVPSMGGCGCANRRLPESFARLRMPLSTAFMTAVSGLPAPSRPRDLRLDFFRGAALMFIFVDHIPENVLSNFTLMAVGF